MTAWRTQPCRQGEGLMHLFPWLTSTVLVTFLSKLNQKIKNNSIKKRKTQHVLRITGFRSTTWGHLFGRFRIAALTWNSRAGPWRPDPTLDVLAAAVITELYVVCAISVGSHRKHDPQYQCTVLSCSQRRLMRVHRLKSQPCTVWNHLSPRGRNLNMTRQLLCVTESVWTSDLKELCLLGEIIVQFFWELHLVNN